MDTNPGWERSSSLCDPDEVEQDLGENVAQGSMVTGQILRFEFDTTTGGNTGAIEIRAFVAA
jgi:hypothetical protein